MERSPSIHPSTPYRYPSATERPWRHSAKNLLSLSTFVLYRGVILLLSKFRETIVCLRRGFWFLYHINFEYLKDNSQIKYLSVRSGKLRAFSTITKSENVPKVKDIFEFEFSWGKPKVLWRWGQVLLVKCWSLNYVECVIGHFFIWICFRNSKN
jgi:hypothetical protein